MTFKLIPAAVCIKCDYIRRQWGLVIGDTGKVCHAQLEGEFKRDSMKGILQKRPSPISSTGRMLSITDLLGNANNTTVRYPTTLTRLAENEETKSSKQGTLGQLWRIWNPFIWLVGMLNDAVAVGEKCCLFPKTRIQNCHRLQRFYLCNPKN